MNGGAHDSVLPSGPRLGPCRHRAILRWAPSRRPRCPAKRWQTSVAPIIRTGCHPERMVPVYAQSESCGAMTMQQVGGYVGAQPAGGRPASISSFVPMLARDRTLDPVKDGVVRGQ